MATKTIKMYLNGDKDSNWSTLAEKGLDELLDEKAQREFSYTLYEVEFDVEVDLETGKTRILKVDGVPLATVGEFQ